MSTYFKRLLPYLFILISAMVLLGANPFKGETVAPTDLLVSQYGWRNLHLASPVTHPVRSDILDARLPRWIHAKSALRDGRLPIWNPYPINGTPGIQWVPAAIITPAFAVFAAMEDNATGYYFAMLTNLVIAASGTYLLLLAMTRSRLASTFGSMVFAYSGYVAAWFFWAHVTTGIWIPWVLLFAFQYLTTRQRRYLPWFSITLAFMVLGGFPTIVVYTLLVLFLLFLVYAPWADGISEVVRGAVQLLLFAILGLLVTLFAIFSLYEMLQFTQSVSIRHGGSPLNVLDLKRFYKPISGNFGDVERTFYVGLLPLALSVISLPLLILKKNRKNSIFALLIIALTIGFVFNLIPQDYIKRIPTFGSNNWGRMSILLPLGFALLAADTISRLSDLDISKLYPYVSIFLVIFLFSIQFTDQKKVFNNFNGAVKSSTFFPTTPTIDYLQESLQPLQSVVADRSYLISGVLANYQIPEWLAHGFRKREETEQLKKVVSANAFKTVTAVSLHCNDIDFDMKRLTQLGIRYLLCKDTLKDNHLIEEILETSGNERFASKPIIQAEPLIQHFELGGPARLNIVSLFLATHNRDTSHADVAIRLYSNGALKGEASVAASEIKDNSWVDFEFPDSVVLDRGKNSLEVSVKPIAAAGQLSTWLYPNQSPSIFIEQGASTEPAVVAARLLNKSPLPDQLTIRHIEPGLVLLENTRIEGSGYFLDQLDPSQNPDFTTVSLLGTNPTSYDFHYTGRQPGWLVLPLRNYPGWQAYIGEKAVDHLLHLEILPAIAVQPGDYVSYRYQPTLQITLALISLVFLLLNIYLCIGLRRQ